LRLRRTLPAGHYTVNVRCARGATVSRTISLQ
jgi:hypothetical protein